MGNDESSSDKSSSDSGSSKALDAARERRESLKTAISRVERAASSPLATATWTADLKAELEALRTALSQHITEVEHPDGLLAELAVDEPRLVNKIEQVQAEHPQLCHQVDTTLAQLDDGQDPTSVREAVLETLFALVRHRQRGADLVFEAYSVDIGGG